MPRMFKASMLLAFLGHYRRAMSILRSGLELAFWGIYFQVIDRENKEKASKLLSLWIALFIIHLKLKCQSGGI